jgi:uncharacterized protein with HEPN domain
MPYTHSRSPAPALRDILDNIDLARRFVAGYTLESYRVDPRTSYAVVRCLEIISEASRRLPEDLKARHPHIPWSDVAGAGSIYRHQYQTVSDDIVWHTVQHDLEPLRVAIIQELERLAQE